MQAWRFAWRTSCALLCLGVLSLFGCGGGVRAGWELHRDELGFEVQYPQGWRAEAIGEHMIRVASADDASFALVYPFLLNRPINAEGCVRQLPHALDQWLPRARVEQVQRRQSKADEAVAVLQFAGPGGPSRASALCSIWGYSGMFYAVAAPSQAFDAQRAVLVDVLDSFKFVEPRKQQTKAADEGVGYQRWTDPVESAFSVEVPNGWRVAGGTARMAPVDVRQWIDVVSPDGAIRITSGDKDLPPFAQPDLMSMFLGQLPGTCYDPAYGYCIVVKSYLPGMDFAAEYVQQSVSGWCQAPRLSARQPRPDVARLMGGDSGGYGILQQRNAGEVRFTCQREGQTLNGYYLASTAVISDVGMGTNASIWNVEVLFGYVAPAQQEKLAQAIIGHMIGTLRYNPQWVAMQQQITGNVSGIVSQTGNEVAQMFNESYWKQQSAYDEVFRNWSNATLGQTDVENAQTGETWKVEYGHNWYWRDRNTGDIVGTNTFDRPDISFDLLREY